jgi:uncharacterized membrane protein YeiH
VAQLYPRALGSPFVASYDSQGYGGGILIRLHTGQQPAIFRQHIYAHTLLDSHFLVNYLTLKMETVHFETSVSITTSN